MVLPSDADLLNPPAELEKRKHKLKCFVQSPDSFFMDVKCQGCFNLTTVCSHSQTVVVCANCQTVLCQPTGASKCESTFNEYATLCTPLHGIRRTVRDLRPTHYLFKVVSYSLLEDDKYESDVFQAGDYKWKLCLYPNGDTKRNGNGHVSLYLQIEDTDTLSRDWEVKVEFKLFVYDQINDKYLTIQGDGDGAIRRFHETKTQWGFPQLVPLDIFKDGMNGYLLDDYCVFGAEVFVLERTEFKSGSLLPKAKALSRDTYAWKIENFSTLKDELYVSQVFALFGIEWKLKVYPNGNGNSKKAMSVYFQLEDVAKDLQVTADFSICLRDQVHNNHHEETTTHLFKPAEADWGFTNFVSLEQLQDPLKGFLKNNTLIIEVQLLKLSLIIKDDLYPMISSIFNLDVNVIML